MLLALLLPGTPAHGSVPIAAVISDDLFTLNQIDNMIQKGDFSVFPLPQENTGASKGSYARVDSSDTDLPKGFEVPGSLVFCQLPLLTCLNTL